MSKVDAPDVIMERLLGEARIWKLSSYGWLDADTADPDLIGHAMWQVDPPVGDALFMWTHSQSDTPPPETTERQQLLAVSGADFEGLVAWARLSIGMLLVEAARIGGGEFADETALELHRASAVLFLSTASDRIRDFFIAAAFESDARDYAAAAKRRGKNPGDYRTPFLEALDQNGAHERAAEALRRLQTLADQVRRLREARNELVHELATEAAIRERSTLREKPQKAAFDVDFASLQKAIQQHKTIREAERKEMIGRLGDWYRLLVYVSNAVFEVENALRPRR